VHQVHQSRQPCPDCKTYTFKAWLANFKAQLTNYFELNVFLLLISKKLAIFRNTFFRLK